MPRRIKAGLIGCGSLAVKGILPHLSEPDAREQVELVAVCDAVQARQGGRRAVRRPALPHGR